MEITDIEGLADLLVLQDDEQCEAELQEALRMLGDSPALRDVWLVGYARGALRAANRSYSKPADVGEPDAVVRELRIEGI